MHIPITLHMNGRKVETIALIDSGATGIFIDRVFAKEHNLRICNLWKEIAVMNVDGTKNQDSSIREYVTANLEVKGRQKDTQFLVTALGTQKVILGYPWLVKANPKLTGENRSSLGGKKPPRSTFMKSCSKFNVKSKKIFTTLTMNSLSPLYKEKQETNMNLPTNGLKDNSISLLSNLLLLKKSQQMLWNNGYKIK